jgi:hypothetical protein
MTVRRVAAAIFQIDRVLAVVLTSNTMILGYFHAHFPEYVVVVSGVLAGVSIFVAVSTKIATILSAASVQKAQLAALPSGKQG